MQEMIEITLQPLGLVLSAPRGAPLRGILAGYGVEFPCGGRGICRACRVRVLEGDAPVTADDERRLTAAELAAGWRLACRLRPQAGLTLEAAQWEAPVLVDETPFAFRPRQGLGIAIDLGTTTLAAQLLDLAAGRVLGVRTALNPQAAYGADIMSRIEAALASRQAAQDLTGQIRCRLGEIAAELSAGRPVREVVIVGNTVMHHLFCGRDVKPLSRVPFRSSCDGLAAFQAAELGWAAVASAEVRFLPCLGGFVGSDILAGILATGMAEARELTALVDLGTNGEIVVGNRERLLCASTAAGPAFEGGRISMGMRAAPGAIYEVVAGPQGLVCGVIGGGQARGICGSGLVDAVAAGLELGVITAGGRLEGARWELLPPVSLSQADVREVQLAKAAVAAAAHILLRRWGAGPASVKRVYLAGAFGNYLRTASARRIGLLPFAEDQMRPAGNTALLGAKLALFENGDFAALRRRVEHVPLAEDPDFQEIYVREMRFPPSGG